MNPMVKNTLVAGAVVISLSLGMQSGWNQWKSFIESPPTKHEMEMFPGASAFYNQKDSLEKNAPEGSLKPKPDVPMPFEFEAGPHFELLKPWRELKDPLKDGIRKV
jgi:hypothetical protein